MTNEARLKQVFDDTNEKLGGALRPLKSNSKVIGRDKELKELNYIMNRRDTPVALLLAPAGAGKTALVGAMINQREQFFHKHVEVFELKIGLMASEGQQVLMTRMNTLLDNLKLYQDEMQKIHPNGEVILFIDEVHTIVTIFGVGTKIGGDLLKDSLARAEEFIKVIAATTNDEFDRYIASDKPLARRFKPISLQEVDRNVTFDILRGWLKAKSVKGEDLNTIVDDETLKYIITNNAAYRPDQHEPAKSIDTLATIHSMHIVDGDPIDKKLVEKAFRTQYDVRLDFSVDAERVFNHIASRVKGQPLALWNMKTMVRNLSFDLEPNTDTPRATALFPGTTGTGKAIYHDTDILSTRDSVTKYRKHGDLVVGDYVFNRKGQPVKVIGVYPQGMQRAYKVTFRNGASVICNDEHLWTYQHSGGNGGKHWKTTELKNLIDKGISRTDKTGRTVHKFRIPTNEAVDMEKQPHSVDPYLVGAFIGNGSLRSKALLFSSNDDFVDNKIKTLLNSDEIIYQEKNYNRHFRLPKEQQTGSIKNYQTEDIFGNMPELIGKYSHEKRIPEQYKLGSVEQRWALIHGLFDTDGSILGKGTRFNVLYDTTSEQLAYDIKEVLASLGFMSTVTSIQRDTREGTQREEFKVRVKAQNKDKHLFFTTPSKRDVAIKSQELVKKREKSFDTIHIESVEDLGYDLPMQCIMVDDPEHLYCVTRDFIVTHNTETTKALAEALYGSEDAIVRVDMVDYGADNMDGRFRRILGRAVSHKPSSIVLLDELEKAHPDVLNVLLPILDEGHLKYTDLGADGYEAEYNVSFKNTIIIATSNAAADALSEMDKYANVKITGQEMTDEFEEYSRNIEDQIIKALQAYSLRPEFIQRFKSIVPFASLSEATLVDITQNMILKKLAKFRDVKGYEVKIPPNKDWSDRGFKHKTDAITMYVVFERMNTEDANRSGARRIKNIIDKEVVGTIIEGIYEHSNFTKFNLRTDGNCTFENPNHAQSKGRLVLEPKG